MTRLTILGLLCLSATTLGLGGQKWNYFGDLDQWHWDTIAPVCTSGRRQSPINIVGMDTLYNPKLSPPIFTWNRNETDAILVSNDGRKIGTVFTGELLVTGADLKGTYRAHGYHWHWGRADYKGSEHLYDGRSFPLEVHLLTYSTRYANASEALSHTEDMDAIAVFGSVYELHPTIECELLNNIIGVFDEIRSPDPNKTIEIEPFNLADMLTPDRSKYFRYRGSLTTPNCQEIVIWTNFVIPRKITKQQMEKFRTLSAKQESLIQIGDNYREVQHMNGRVVQRNFPDISPPQATCYYTYGFSNSAAVLPSSILLIIMAIIIAV